MFCPIFEILFIVFWRRRVARRPKSEKCQAIINHFIRFLAAVRRSTPPTIDKNDKFSGQDFVDFSSKYLSKHTLGGLL
jgi:hypothetical protein